MDYKTTKIKVKNLKSKEYEFLKKLCWHSARLYNVSLYNIRQTFFAEKKYLKYESNYHLAKLNENFELMPSAVAQQIMKVVDRSFKSFFALLKKAKKGNYQYNKIQMPHYLKREDHFLLIFPTSAFRIKNDRLYIGVSNQSKKEGIKDISFRIPDYLKNKKIKEVRLIPKLSMKYFNLEIVYESPIHSLNLNKNSYLSIDIGINNLMTCFDQSNNKTFIVNGKQLKNINYYWNKQIAKLSSIKDKQKNKKWTKRMYSITEKRNNRIMDIMRKSTKFIIDYCIKNNIGNIVIGRNIDMKRDINIGSKNNQNFVQIPFNQLFQQLSYRSKEIGIKYIEVEESYTSKCSSIDNEIIEYHDTYMGTRIKRGLFKTKNNLYINADVNGSINILRKATGIGLTPDQIKGILVYPLKIRVS